MAKIIFYLHAVREQTPHIIRAAQELALHKCFTEDGLALAVMTPRPSDLLAVPADSRFLTRLAVILEIVLPPGRPLSDLLPDLELALVPVLERADRGQSYLVAGYQRTFQQSGPKPVRYHYLMYRLGRFSRSDYLDYYVHSHYRFGVATPLADYYQNYLDAQAGRELAQVFGVNSLEADNISELRFDSVETYLFSDIIREVGPAASADEALFVDRERCQSFSMDVLLDTGIYS
jgi:hypothetical protein